MTISLEVHICDQRRSYFAKFATDDQAAAFIARKGLTHAFFEDEAAPLLASTAPKTLEALYPLCGHGMSLSLCAGPGHYPADM